ncbi:MAG: hypothetical protein EOP49_33205 [Sphingobacteriales bacterium]|nr:MAG: hypothetical protein EOP49_33205 [Sphingobacteriales bacterium]
MNKYLTGIIAGGIIFCALAFQAPRRPGNPNKIVHKGKAFLANGQTSGTISKRAFDSVLAYGLFAKDSANNEHPVVQYTFTYAERGAYEDSTGRLKIMTEYYSMDSDKGKLPDFWVKSIKDRTKGGDTATFVEIMSVYQDGKTRFYAEPIKLILTD